MAQTHSMKSSDKSIIDVVTILTARIQKIFAENYNDEKLAVTLFIVETGLIDYYFLYNKDGRQISWKENVMI